jgi:hypothetical protein
MFHPTSAKPSSHFRSLALAAFDPVVIGQGFS